MKPADHGPQLMKQAVADRDRTIAELRARIAELEAPKVVEPKTKSPKSRADYMRTYRAKKGGEPQ